MNELSQHTGATSMIKDDKTSTDLELIQNLGTLFLERADEMLEPLYPKSPDPTDFWADPEPEYFDLLPQSFKNESHQITAQLVQACNEIAELSRNSILITDADKLDVVRAAKEIRAALRLRAFRYWDADVIHDEGRVLGISPARQSEDSPIRPPKALQVLNLSFAKIFDVVALLSGAFSNSLKYDNAAGRVAQRPNTAFIMMAIDKSNPELADVLDVVKTVFKSFDITALRADEIEHQELITARVLQEIESSEFLFADLTGERPNVYYEIGYAHALKRRVILFCRSKTGLHFDLAGYNCPQYDNMKDLREKLVKRLIELTNRQPRTI